MVDYKAIIEEANEAAEKAANEWLEKAVAAGPKYSVHSADLAGNLGSCVGELLDVCGNAHVHVKDKRTKFAKYLIKEEKRQALLNGRRYFGGGNLTVPMWYTHRRRQEWGLHTAAVEAAIEVFRKYDIKVQKWSYID